MRTDKELVMDAMVEAEVEEIRFSPMDLVYVDDRIRRAALRLQVPHRPWVEKQSTSACHPVLHFQASHPACTAPALLAREAPVYAPSLKSSDRASNVTLGWLRRLSAVFQGVFSAFCGEVMKTMYCAGPAACSHDDGIKRAACNFLLCRLRMHLPNGFEKIFGPHLRLGQFGNRLSNLLDLGHSSSIVARELERHLAVTIKRAGCRTRTTAPQWNVQLVTNDVTASRGVTVNVVGKVHFEHVVGDRHRVLKGGCDLDGSDVFALFIAYLDRLEHQLLPGRDMLGHNVTNGVHGLIASCIEIFQFGTFEIANEGIPLSQVKEVFRHKVGSRFTLVEPRVPPRVPRRIRTLPSQKPVGTSVEASAFGREIIQDLSEFDGGPFCEEHHRDSVDDHCQSGSAVDHRPGAVAVSACPESSFCGNAHEAANNRSRPKLRGTAQLREVGL